jgi:hypothetical protein
VPGPIRRAARRIPGALRFAADAVTQSGLEPSLRRWLVRPAAQPASGGTTIS